MSKRYINPQEYGQRKKAKLDISISDHNFPLSQNRDNDEKASWGDDNEDEILLLASQACEQAYSNDISTLPNYSICMQPTSTSTQLYDQPTPSTSKAEFSFKKPSTGPSMMTSTSLKDKCHRISSPLPGISSKLMSNPNGLGNMTDDLIFNDKIYKGQDSDYVYKQLLQLQEENAKLKSENGKLLDKCVTKEGEASILRTQLKTCQVAVDNARLERVRAQEKVQMEWTEKLAAVNTQLHDLRTQLDFKNLEIISMKDKCRVLESNKVKLTQVTVAANDITSSHRNSTIHNNDSFTQRRLKTTSTFVQTERKAHFLKLNKTCRIESSKLDLILPHILEPTSEEHSILDHNEKLQQHSDTQKCRVFSTFHRLPSTPAPSRESKTSTEFASINEDLTSIAMGNEINDQLSNVLKSIKTVLCEVQQELETVSQRMSTAFQKEMDEKYIEATAVYNVVGEENLLQGSAIYKEEQGILARRMTAVLAYILQHLKVDIVHSQRHRQSTENIIEVIARICYLLDNNSCGVLYSGLLLSITELFHHLPRTEHTINVLKAIITSRPMQFVTCHLLTVMRRMSVEDNFKSMFCPGSNTGNLKLDYEQGVLLYKKDSCHLQVFLKQMEACLKCIERQKLTELALHAARELAALGANIGDLYTPHLDNGRCECQQVLLQVIVFALRLCALFMKHEETKNKGVKSSSNTHAELVAACRGGALLLYRCSLRDLEFSSQLGYYEGHLIQFCEIMTTCDHPDVYGNMITELSNTFQSTTEDTVPLIHKQPWINSFQNFSITD